MLKPGSYRHRLSHCFYAQRHRTTTLAKRNKSICDLGSFIWAFAATRVIRPNLPAVVKLATITGPTELPMNMFQSNTALRLINYDLISRADFREAKV